MRTHTDNASHSPLPLPPHPKLTISPSAIISQRQTNGLRGRRTFKSEIKGVPSTQPRGGRRSHPSRVTTSRQQAASIYGAGLNRRKSRREKKYGKNIFRDIRTNQQIVDRGSCERHEKREERGKKREKERREREKKKRKQKARVQSSKSYNMSFSLPPPSPPSCPPSLPPEKQRPRGEKTNTRKRGVRFRRRWSTLCGLWYAPLTGYYLLPSYPATDNRPPQAKAANAPTNAGLTPRRPESTPPHRCTPV